MPNNSNVSMESNSDPTNYNLFFRQFVACLSTSNDSDGFINMVPLQSTRKENPASLNMLNTFQPEESLPKNSPTEMFAGLDVANQLQIPAENLGGLQILNIFPPNKRLFSGSENIVNHFSCSPRQLLPNNATENLDNPEKFPSEQILERPNENPREDESQNQITSEAIEEIFPEKDDYSLSFVYQEGLNYCGMADKTEANSTNIITIEEKSKSGLNPKVKGSLKIIDLLAQNLPKSVKRRRKRNGQKINKLKRKLQAKDSSTSGSKEDNLTYNEETPSLLAAALINRNEKNSSEKSSTPIPSSVSPPTVKRLSRSSSVVDSDSNRPTIPSRFNPAEAETQKWQSSIDLVGSSNWKGVDEQLLISPFNGQKNQSFQTSLITSLSAPITGMQQTPTSQQTTTNLVPLNATQIVAKILNSSTSTQSQKINGIVQNQQLKQLQPAEMDFSKQVPNQNFTSFFSQESNYIIPKSSANTSSCNDGKRSFYNMNPSNLSVEVLHRGQNSFDHAKETVGSEMDIAGTSNFASLNMGEKEFESMVNWPEHHLMGTDRFGFDV
ncbi:hypothetical protein ACH5RR_002684 [Cinchona calisaya]|uniref:Uncharacterized protein n=1 Tax=Cinchona calisaya TaxID=153742 RepID=A0ABD3ASS7_9GENT